MWLIVLGTSVSEHIRRKVKTLGQKSFFKAILLRFCHLINVSLLHFAWGEYSREYNLGALEQWFSKYSHRQAVSTSLGDLLEMQILRSHPKPG